MNASGSVTYAVTSGYTGTDAFAYTVRDSLGARSQRAVVNIVIQPAPVAVNDSRTLDAGQLVTIDVLANDTSSGGTIDATSITVAAQPAHGAASVVNGQVTYAPAAGYSGVDSFQYSVKDNLGTVSNNATVSLSIQPAPVVAPPPSGGGGGGGGSFGTLELLALLGFLVYSCRSWLRNWARRST